ncbi:hypothetical protein ACJJTC_005789 [Scirpophaga incertulas]
MTPDAAVTGNLVANMDKLFDALNSESSDLRRGKPESTNLTATSPHLKLFSEMKTFFLNMKYIGSPRKPSSQEGWIWTINGNLLKDGTCLWNAESIKILQKSLNYSSKDLVTCVEYCACIINNFLKEKGHISCLSKTVLQNLKENVDFNFLQCETHKEENMNKITLCVPMICVKRFCILKNRKFAEESSAIALKRKMNIILHK